MENMFLRRFPRVWQEVWKWGVVALKVGFQGERSPGRDGKVIEENGLYWIHTDSEVFQAGIGYYSSRRGVGQGWN